MGTPLDAGNEIAAGALIAIIAASCVIPDAWPVAAKAYSLQADPGAMFAGAQAWLDSAGQIGEALQAAIDINNSLAGTGWAGADADAFAERAADYIRQLMMAQALAYTVGVAIIIAAIITFLEQIVLAVIAAVLAFYAAAILAALAGVVSAPAAASLELNAAFFAIEAEIGLTQMDAATKVTDAVLAAGIGVLLIGDVAVQLATGNEAALGDLAQATVDGLGTITAAMIGKLYGKVVKGAIGTNINRGPLDTLLTAIGLTDKLTGTSLPKELTAPLDPAH